MSRTKYIVLDDTMAIIFSDLMTHADVAESFRRYGSVTGAGFITVTDDEIVPYGESLSLGIGPGKNDIKALRRVFNRYE